MDRITQILQRIGLGITSLLLVSSLGVVSSGNVAAATPSKLVSCTAKVKGQKHPKKITKTISISYKTIKQPDTTLLKGQTQTKQAGQNGQRRIIYTASYKKGKLHGCKQTANKVITEPVDAIVMVGTYVAPAPTPTPTPVSTPAPTDCTNGTYVNSAGNTVCSPEAAPSAPAGATAQCVDGTYSFSQSHSGTCSHHGGVAQWLD